MNTFQELNLKAVYRTEEDNLLEDFYIPALRVSTSYDRAVGYFSAAMLSYAAQGLTSFFQNNGHVRLLIGSELSDEETEAIEQGYVDRDIIERLGEAFKKQIFSADDDLLSHRLKALSHLIAMGRLDIKVALRKRGMYHEKIGIMRDAAGDLIVFQGSANETANALRPDLNFESISVYRSWIKGHQEFAEPYKKGFESLWKNDAKNTLVIDFPEALRRKLIDIAVKHPRPPREKLELYLNQNGLGLIKPPNDEEGLNPAIPEYIGIDEYKLRSHQEQAILRWQSNDFHGVFALATGSGKTITAIHAAVRVYEANKRQKKPICIVVAVPYINLADQWLENLNIFNIFPISCYQGKERWEERLRDAIAAFKLGATDHLCLVVVNKTLASDTFQQYLDDIPGENLLWIGDECHHHGSQNLSHALPKKSKYRIGLSATPDHYIDQEANQRLSAFYGNVVATYTLADAIKDDVLSPYKYYPCIVELTLDEAEIYHDLSKQIASLSAATANKKQLSENKKSTLEQLLLKRSRLLGGAANKIPALEHILKNEEAMTHTLFYCGDGSMEDGDNDDQYVRQIEVISKKLGDLGWKTSRFTSEESKRMRRDILQNFKVGAIDAMVAIKCLDEGVDIPACKKAFLLASARNPRQFIQRRGRILRKSENKEYAAVYDFIVKLPSNEDEKVRANEKKLISAELERVAEFSNTSLNAVECYRLLEPILSEYGLEHKLT